MPPEGIVGRLVSSLCPFPDESADVNQSWCQSVKPIDRFPRLLNVWPPKTPNSPLVSRGAICLAYIHSQMNLHMCAKFGANRSSRLIAFPEFVLRLVRLLAAVLADSRKNTQKNNIYTSKIIIPARTCWHKRNYLTAIFLAFCGALAEELKLKCMQYPAIQSNYSWSNYILSN